MSKLTIGLFAFLGGIAFIGVVFIIIALIWDAVDKKAMKKEGKKVEDLLQKQAERYKLLDAFRLLSEEYGEFLKSYNPSWNKKICNPYIEMHLDMWKRWETKSVDEKISCILTYVERTISKLVKEKNNFSDTYSDSTDYSFIISLEEMEEKIGVWQNTQRKIRRNQHYYDRFNEEERDIFLKEINKLAWQWIAETPLKQLEEASKELTNKREEEKVS